MTLNVGSEGMGRWSRDFLGVLIERTFPHTRVSFDDTKPADLVVRSHFLAKEPPRADSQHAPYISWSGESYPVVPRSGQAPVLEFNTAHTGCPNEIWFPHIVAEIPRTERPATAASDKRWCASYAFSHRVPERERLFWSLRVKEPTCYGFGASCRTPDIPFVLPASQRGENGRAFRDFGYVVAMENKVAPGYLTEKIGYAFLAGTVPIYWGDRATVEEFFNPASFIQVDDFASADAAATHCVEVWRDRQKLQKYLDAPIVLNNRLADYEAIRTEYRPWQAPFMDKLREAFPDLS
jgi:hypothetical protein